MVLSSDRAPMLVRGLWESWTDITLRSLHVAITPIKRKPTAPELQDSPWWPAGRRWWPGPGRGGPRPRCLRGCCWGPAAPACCSVSALDPEASPRCGQNRCATAAAASGWSSPEGGNMWPTAMTGERSTNAEGLWPSVLRCYVVVVVLLCCYVVTSPSVRHSKPPRCPCKDGSSSNLGLVCPYLWLWERANKCNKGHNTFQNMNPQKAF